MKRIDRISSFVPTPATGSQLWTASVFLTALLLCVAMAFCQSREPATVSPEATGTSLQPFLKIEGLKSYRVDKRIADFPADKIDLRTPEASYATQKNLIVSSRKDKLEQLSNITVGRPTIPERERRGMEEISEEWAQTYRDEFTVFEVYVLNDKYAFVFGLRRFDMLYDGNFFEKHGDEWLNKGNDQSMNAEDIAKRVQQGLSHLRKP